MAAVMLAGAPLCNEAFAAVNYNAGTVADVKLENGVKFVLDNGSATLQAASVTTTDKKVYMVASTAPEAKDAVFEVVNYQKSALGATFGLKVNGKTFAYETGGKYYTTFFTKVNTGKEYSLANITSFDAYLEDGTQASNVFSGYNVSTTDLTYGATELNDFNQSSTSFSFGADAVEGNIFNGLTPLNVTKTLADGTSTASGVIFVKGSADDIKKLDWNKKESAAKVSVAYVKNEAWNLNTSAAGEGYKLVMVNGADFLATEKPAVWDNAVFTRIVEADQLNAEGEIDLTINPIVGTSTDPTTNLKIAAVKTSASDTKTYVTTVVSTGSKYAKVIKPTLGDNTYFAASEFLSTGKSVYNVYFTSGKESVKDGITTEYHKYLTVIGGGSAYQADALAANDVQLNSPFAQWVATNFDGKYTLTLTNRQTMKDVVLKLNATKTAGVYKIVSASGDFTNLPNLTNLSETSYDEKELAGKQIKLVKTTVTKTDGFLDLTKEEMAAKVALKFSGKSAELGKTSFYAVPNYDKATDEYNKLYPSQDEKKIAFYDIAKTNDEYLNEISYAYINADGQVVADAVDTLQVPVYNISYSYFKKNADKATVAYVTDQQLNLDETASPSKLNVYFPLAMNGSYTMGRSITSAPSAITSGTKAIGVDVQSIPSTAQFDAIGSALFAPKDGGFSYVTVIVNDNKNRTSLEAASRHATFENSLGAVSMQENKNGIIEGIIAAEPATFWLDTLTNGDEVSFYISKGIKAAEETKADEAAAMRNFMFYANDSLYIFDEGSALATVNKNYLLEGTDSDVKAIFRPATLVAHDTLTTVVDGKEKTLAKAAAKAFQYGIVLADEEVAGEYVVYSKANPAMFLYNLNGKLGFTTDEKKALVVKLGEGDATANEAIAAENNVAVIAGEGVVTVKGAAGKQVVVSNILGQVIANKVATSDEETIAVAAGVAVVVVDGGATKVVVK